MVAMKELETGDKTYTSRVERYEYANARRQEKPRPTLQEIADELGISRQNVWRLLNRGTVRPSGRPRNSDGRRQRLVTRLAKWQDRRNAKLAKSLDASYEKGWIDKLEVELEQLK